MFPHHLHHQPVSAAVLGSEPVLMGTQNSRTALAATAGATLADPSISGVLPGAISALDPA